MSQTETKISTLWVVVMFNIVFADVLSFINPGMLQELWAGQSGVQVSPELLLVFAVLLEIPIAMIFLSRILQRAANRWANTVAVLVTTVFVIGGGSLDLHYVFFAVAEVAGMALIMWYVWTRLSPEAAVSP